MGCSQSNDDEFQWKDRKEGRFGSKNKAITEDDLKLNNSCLVIGKTESIGNYYKLIKKIGSGTFGIVYKVKHKLTNTYRAMKVVKRDTINYQDDNKQFLKEIEILSNLDHPNVMKIYEYFVDEINYYVMSELATGGELYEQLYKRKSYTEADTAIIMEQLFSAVNYIHSKDIVHRDIKPENILLESSDITKEPFIKLIDFGTANYVKDEEILTLKVGTPYYTAPEVLKRHYNKQCDVWSLGIIMYFLLCGSPPFDGFSDKEIFSKILTCKYSFEGEEWDLVSKEAKSLISKLLVVDPKLRITAAEAKQDPWIIKFDKIKKNYLKEKLNVNTLSRPFENLRKFNAKQKLQQSTIAFLVRQLSNSEVVKNLRNIFRSLDKNGDGSLSIEEIKEGFKTYYGETISEEEWAEIANNLDQDGSNSIEYEEFIRSTINLEDILTDKNLKLAFDFYDKDGSGYLDVNEIKSALGIIDNDVVTNQLIQNIIKNIDENSDGQISFDEFKDLMLKVINCNKVNDSNTINLSKNNDNVLNSKKNLIETNINEKEIDADILLKKKKSKKKN